MDEREDISRLSVSSIGIASTSLHVDSIVQKVGHKILENNADGVCHSDVDRKFYEAMHRNDSFCSSKSTGESDFETSAPGKPLHALLSCNDDECGDSNLKLIDSDNYDDQEQSTAIENDAFESSSKARPEFHRQTSNIAEIVEHSGSLLVADQKNKENELSASEEQLAAAWNVPKADEKLEPDDVEEDFVATSYLRQRLKHVFILSTAGKPIYSRYGNEEELSSLMGVMQALVSFILSNAADELVSIRAGSWKCLFLHRPPLILVAASRASDSYAQLKQLLVAIHQQIFSILTATQLTKIFEHRTNFDLRRLLAGTERSFQSLINFTETNASLFLNSAKIHPMSGPVREAVGQALSYAISHYSSKLKNHLVFAIVVANDQLITIARMKRYTLHPSDLHLIINLVASNPSFKHAESSLPICLPMFDKTGFLHAYISYLSDECRACLLLLTVDRGAFYTLSDVKKKVVEKLEKTRMLPLFSDFVVKRHGFRLNEIGVNDLWHFLYKNQSSHQFTCPEFDPPFTNPTAQQRLFAVYLKVHHQMHTSGKPLKVFFTSVGSEVVLGWVRSSFELYAVFAPLTSKASAIAKVDKLMKWLKEEENKLFIINPPFY